MRLGSHSELRPAWLPHLFSAGSHTQRLQKTRGQMFAKNYRRGRDNTHNSSKRLNHIKAHAFVVIYPVSSKETRTGTDNNCLSTNFSMKRKIRPVVKADDAPIIDLMMLQDMSPKFTTESHHNICQTRKKNLIGVHLWCLIVK